MKTIRLMTELEYNLQHVMAAKQSFEHANPDVRIEVVQATDYYEILQSYRSEEAPDIVETGGYPMGDPHGIFIDLNPYVAEIEGLEEDFHAGLLRAARYKVALSALPVEVSPPLIAYNKLLFDRAGIDYPSEGWTWDDMIQVAKKLTIRDEQGLVKQYGLRLGVDIEWFEPFVMRNGGRYVSPDGSTARGYVDSEATVEAFKLLIDAFRVHRIVCKPNESIESVASAMTFSFIWNTGDLLHHHADDQIAMVGLPRMPGRGAEQANMIYMGGTGITKKSEHPQLAWKFLHHYILECNSWFPPLTKSQTEKRDIFSHPIWSRYVSELDIVQPGAFFLNGKWNASRQLINEEIVKMIVNGIDVEKTLRSWTRYA